MHKPFLIACHDCDLLQRVGPLPEGATARCRRCGDVLYRQRSGGREHTLAMALAGLILFGVSISFPLLVFEVQGQGLEATLITASRELFRSNMQILGTVVFLTVVLLPFLVLSGIVYVLLPLRFGRTLPALPQVFRMILHLRAWCMLEVFVLGVLVSIVKLSSMGRIIPGLAMYAYVALIFVMVATISALNEHRVWDLWDRFRKKHRRSRPPLQT